MAIARPDALVDLGELYYRMAFIRRFEERLLVRFRDKQLSGTTHTYIGQEATAVAALSMLQPGDFVCSQHRSHGYFLAAGGDPRALFLEILGDVGGVCNGVGGSQHLYTTNFLSSGILGGTPGLAAGLAFAEKLRRSGNIVISFIGDGTLGEGLTYESFNLASLWRLPILFVVENNRYAQTTPVEANLAGTISGRVAAYGIAVGEVESNDVVTLHDAFALALGHVRRGAGPFCQIVNTYRLGPHSRGDDQRPESEKAAWRAKDPLILAEKRLGEAAPIILQRADTDAATATELPLQTQALALDALTDDRTLIPAQFESKDGWRIEGAGRWLVSHLQQVFAALLKEHSDVYLLGEDIIDPYGGAFKVYQGLSSAHSGRVISTPVSEAGIVAVANGMALRGFRPIVEIMFGDFVTLAFDQVVNHAAKFAYMYRNGVSCPVIVRVPSGGYRGYGPTHSQCLEKFFLGVAGLVVTASDIIHDSALLWERMLGLRSPCIHVENKSLYGTELPHIAHGRVGPFRMRSSRSYFPTTTLSLAGPEDSTDVAIVAYGGLVGMAMEAALNLFYEDEIVCDVIVPSQLSPLPELDLAKALAQPNKIVVLEEGTERAGFGAELIAKLSCSGALDDKRVARCAALDTIIPSNADLEKQVLPSVNRLVSLVRSLH
jgi:2-oxoisovalerate dehydrogenase E1 component